MKINMLIVGIFLVLLFTSTAFGAFLEQDYETKETETVVRPPDDRIFPPRSRNEVTSLMDRVSVGKARHERNMTVFPLYLSREEDARQYITLDIALDRGYLKILEKGSATVSRIDVENVSNKYVFLMAGEILGGGKQNRIISKDVLLQPRGRVVSVPVYCVEQHRWSSKKSGKFYSAKSIAPNNLRYMTQAGESQDKIWKEVGSISKANKVSSSTGNFQAVFEDTTVRKQIALYNPLRRMPRETIGVVVVVNGRIIGAEIFCNEDLFEDLWPKILKSYSLDAISKPRLVRESHYRAPDITARDAKRYLDRVYGARYNDERAVDVGSFLNLSGRISGKALLFRRAVIHLNLAGARNIILER